MTMNQELADITALKAIAYLVADEEKREWLMAETGLSPDDLAGSTDAPEVLAGVLDFLLTHEEILVDFCTAWDVEPTLLAKIRPLFPGATLEY
ncbi:MAG: DUF3572 domain-containing protein [Sneathiella sp.]